MASVAIDAIRQRMTDKQECETDDSRVMWDREGRVQIERGRQIKSHRETTVKTRQQN